MLASDYLTNTYLVSHPNQSITENEFNSYELSTTNSSIKPISQYTDNRTLIENITEIDLKNEHQYDLKYSFMFIINFQVILFNGLIINHVLRAKSFQKSSSARCFILSLAISDILVGLCVMPLGIIALIVNTWMFGKLWCELWQVIDFFSCTASIFNLCTVSIDRYIAISKPLLYMKMSNTRVCLIIALVWASAALITFPPMIAERAGYVKDICNGKDCTNCGSLFDFYPFYVIFATITSFFLPVLLVIVTNYRTYLIVKRHMFARTNNGRISLPSASSKSKSKKQSLFLKLSIFFCKKETNKNCSIELDSLDPDNHQKNQPVLIVNNCNKKTSRTDHLNNQFNCGCDRDLLDNRLYLHTSTSINSNKSLLSLRVNKFFNWLFRRNCSNVESRIISSSHNPYYSSCNHHANLQELNNFALNDPNKRTCSNRLTKCLVRCCTLNGLLNLSSRQSSLSKFGNSKHNGNCRTFLFLNNANHSSNIQILSDLTNNNQSYYHHHLNSLKQPQQCTYCALNSLNNNSIHFNSNCKVNQFRCNEELLVDEESTSGGNRNRLENKDTISNLSILMNNNSKEFNNELIVNESSTNTNDVKTTIDSINLSPNSKSSCSKDYLNQQQLSCCGYCCHCHCLDQCQDCKTEFNRLLVDIFTPSSSTKGKDRKPKKNDATKSNASKSGSKNFKICKPQHHLNSSNHLNCTHFKNNQMLTNSKKQLNSMSTIQQSDHCGFCGNALIYDKCKSNQQPSKALCLHRFSTNHLNHPQQLSSNQRCCQQRMVLNGANNLHFNQQVHHCIHLHFHHFNQHHRQTNAGSIYSEPFEPLSAESESRSTQGVNSNLNSGAEKELDGANKTSANNSSFDDELRINYGTGLQKSIGFYPASTTNRKNNPNSSNETNRLNTIRREYRATKTLGIITAIFVIMWLPYYFCFLLSAILPDCFFVKNFSSYLLHHFLWIGWSNSYVNCLLYMYFSRKLRNSVINTLLCRKS